MQDSPRRRAQIDRQLYARRRGLVIQPLALRGIMCLYVTSLSLHNVDCVLRGPSTGFPTALTDSTALRVRYADMPGLERRTVTELAGLIVHAEPLITSV